VLLTAFSIHSLFCIFDILTIICPGEVLFCHVFFCMLGTRDWTQIFSNARQALYHLSHTLNSFVFHHPLTLSSWVAGAIGLHHRIQLPCYFLMPSWQILLFIGEISHVFPFGCFLNHSNQWGFLFSLNLQLMLFLYIQILTLWTMERYCSALQFPHL
jgi:hypothetical protein